MSCGLAIFVKTPVLSPVKTRLWPALGQQNAEALYLLSAEAVASVAEQADAQGSVSPYWAVAEGDALGSDAWADLPRLAQGEGGLGERMAAVHRALLERHGAALLIGADAPQLKAGDLQNAADWLATDERRWVIGRAADGGFWLFGANYPIATDVWTSVAYSRDDTAEAFVRALGGHARGFEMPTLHDLDTAPDLAPVFAALTALPRATPAQRRLADWLERLNADPAPVGLPLSATIQLAV